MKAQARRTLPLALIPLILGSIIAAAAVFVYYPVTISISPVTPPIIFTGGTNSNQTDLAGNTIDVYLGKNWTSATLNLHPTYQTTYYTDVLRIKNQDQSGNSYNVYIRVVTPVSLPSGSTAKLEINNGTETKTVDLTTAGDTLLGSLSAGSEWIVNVTITIPEGNKLVSSTSASLQLIYSPETETPPQQP